MFCYTVFFFELNNHFFKVIIWDIETNYFIHFLVIFVLYQ